MVEGGGGPPGGDDGADGAAWDRALFALEGFALGDHVLFWSHGMYLFFCSPPLPSFSSSPPQKKINLLFGFFHPPLHFHPPPPNSILIFVSCLQPKN